jgi:glutaredoxin 3
MITIYKTLHCPYCRMVEQLLQKKNITYKLYSLDDDPSMRQKLIEKTGAMTVPITTDGKTYVVGWKPKELLKLIKS